MATKLQGIGRPANRQGEAFLAAAVTFQGAAIGVHNAGFLGVAIAVTNPTGTPTLTPEVLWSADGVNFASAPTPDTLTAVVGAGATVAQVTVKAPFYQLDYVITGGTPAIDIETAIQEG